MDRRIVVAIDCVECQQQQLLKVRPDDLEKYQAGAGHVQDIFPYLLPSEREVLLSRICGDCWDRMFDTGDEE